MFDGATPFRPVPPGPRTILSRSYSGTVLSSSAKQDSSSDTSTTWPRPKPSESRLYRAESTPMAANMPASESPSEMWMRGGGSPSKPLMYRMPPIASATEAKPARGAYGPVWP